MAERTQAPSIQGPRWPVAAVLAGYLAAAWVGLAFASVHPLVSSVWPASGVAVAALAVWGRRMAAPVFVGALAANLGAMRGLPLWDQALPAALGIAVGNTLEALAAHEAIRRLCGPGAAAFGSPAGVMRFAAAAALAPVAAALVGPASLWATGLLAPGGAAVAMATWHLGDALGILIVAPWLILLSSPAAAAPRPHPGELAALGAVLAGLGGVLFLAPPSPLLEPLVFVGLAPLMWAALRLGARGAAGALVFSCALAVAGTVAGRGPLGGLPPPLAILLLQAFTAMAALVALPAAALVAQRRRFEHSLERRVQERTVTMRAEVEQRRAAEAAMRESLERFKVLAESSPLGVFRTTARGQVDYANERWHQVSGCASLDAAAMRRAVHPDDVGRLADEWRAALREGRELVSEFRFVHADGSVHPCRTRAAPVRDRDGNVAGFVGTLEDLTEVRAAEARERENQRLRELTRFKSDFLRSAAHELGNPMTPVRLQARLLKQMLATAPEEQRRAVDILDRNVGRMQVIVQDMLESARLQSSRLQLAARPVDLAHVVHDAVETFQEQAIEAGVALDLHGPPRLPVVADPDRVTQVLYNLLSNAMKFTPAGGSVHVRVALQDGRALVTVSDTGDGFTREQAARLFQPFSRVHEFAQGRKSGTGLGLYISRGIAQLHGGDLAAHSDGPGRGATFTLAIPLAPPTPPEAEGEGRPVARAPHRLGSS
jgi:PAS domain S-box-containing protein